MVEGGATRPVETYCREQSLAIGEPIAGTAVADVDRWIILQYQGVWAAKAYPNASLPAAVRHHLDEALAAVPRSRLQLIRRPDPRPTAGLALYLARSGFADSALLGFRLSSYEALLGVDLRGHLEGTASGQSPRRSKPLYLVCTHGTRDRCCALWGQAVYARLYDRLGDGVWQADHLGGHRFAANVLELPSGLSFGRLTVEDVPDFVVARERGELLGVDRYRGRCAYSAVVQAAEWYALRERGAVDPRSLRFVGAEPAEPGWSVTFEDVSSGGQCCVTVGEEPLSEELSMSCGADARPATGFVLLGLDPG